MHTSKEHKGSPELFQFLIVALLTAVLFGLFLLCRNGRSATLYWITLSVCLFFTPKAWLRELKSVLLQWWDMDWKSTRRLLATALIATVLFSLAAHMFMFGNEFFNHDSTYIIAYSKYMRGWASAGRFLVPLIDTLVGSVAVPWLLGLLFTFWMFLAGVLAIRLLHIHNAASRVLVCGLLCTNTTLSILCANFTFLISTYSLALMLALAAAYFFCCCRHGEIMGVYCMMLSMLIYQPYFCVALVFCFFSVVRMLVCHEAVWTVIRRGIRCLALMLASFCLYSAVWSGLCGLYGVEKARVNEVALSYGLDMLLQRFFASFSNYFQTQLTSQNFLGRLFPAIHLLGIALLLFWLLGWLMDQRLPKSNKVLLTIAICMLPAVFNAAYIVCLQGNQTHLAVSKEFLGIFLLLCMSCPPPRVPARRRSQAAALLLASALLWHNIVHANELYIKMDMNKAATVSLFTRIIERVERLEGYVPGTTSVAFSGALFANNFLMRGRSGYEWFTGYNAGASSYDYSVSYTAAEYIKNYLNYPMNFTSPPTEEGAVETIQSMPVFPFEGSIDWVGDTVVIKLA